MCYLDKVDLTKATFDDKPSLVEEVTIEENKLEKFFNIGRVKDEITFTDELINENLETCYTLDNISRDNEEYLNLLNYQNELIFIQVTKVLTSFFEKDFSIKQIKELFRNTTENFYKISSDIYNFEENKEKNFLKFKSYFNNLIQKLLELTPFNFKMKFNPVLFGVLNYFDISKEKSLSLKSDELAFIDYDLNTFKEVINIFPKHFQIIENNLVLTKELKTKNATFQFVNNYLKKITPVKKTEVKEEVSTVEEVKEVSTVKEFIKTVFITVLYINLLPLRKIKKSGRSPPW